MLDKLLFEYAERFNESFPVYSFPGDEDDMIKAMEKSLAENKPYKPNIEEDIDYEREDY